MLHRVIVKFIIIFIVLSERDIEEVLKKLYLLDQSHGKRNF
ncbi:MAG: hypothetical protein OXN83_04520 [Oligoflexia bacterium]|nr:hypothetical protein [Oligoflexia bacterium]